MKLGIVCDYLEEGWVSMDICARMLCERAAQLTDLDIQPLQMRPSFRWRLKYLQQFSSKSFNGDRFLNRFINYPRYLKPRSLECDFFHVVDHSYAHLVHSLPAARTGVFCHDLNAFESVLEPEKYPRSWLYQQMSTHLLTGMQQAAIVFHTTQAVRQQIEAFDLIDPAKLVAAPLGVSPEYHSDPVPTDRPMIQLQSQLAGRPYILHVGSCIPRKRIDLLLDIFTRLRADIPELYLVKAGGKWSKAQQQQIVDLGLGESIVHLTNLHNTTIAQLYRHAQIVLLTSEAEGFGMPLIEALACGAIVLATDLPVLHEVGGDAVIYCPLGDIEAWSAQSRAAIVHPDSAPSIDLRLAQAARYSWDNHARIVCAAYDRLSAGRL
jgi:glycosyltransferase involved in cell wall biosynthesis